jgi:hypothetical protein
MKKFSNVPLATGLLGASLLFMVACGDEEPSSNDHGAGGVARREARRRAAGPACLWVALRVLRRAGAVELSQEPAARELLVQPERAEPEQVARPVPVG